MLVLHLALYVGCVGSIFPGAPQEPALKPAPATAPTRTSGVRLQLRIEPFVDAFAHVRHSAEQASTPPAAPPSPPELTTAIALVRALDQDLGSPLLWGPIEGCLASAQNLSEARAHASKLPEERELRSGTKVALRARALELLEALERYEPVHRTGLWLANEVALRNAATEIERRLLPREREIFAAMQQHLGLDVGELEIPILLVRRGASPGAVTVRDASGRGACFVALEGNEGTLLFETMLHESLHALDLASKRGVLVELRTQLGAAGIGPRDRELRDAPHALIFAEAGEIVRRTLDPEHRSYAERHDLYVRFGSYGAEVPILWRRHLAGELDRPSVLEALVNAVRSAREKK